MALGHHGYDASFAIGLVLGLCVLGLASGGAGLAKKQLKWPILLGIAGAATVIFMAIGPTISSSYARSDEARRYEELTDAMKKDSFTASRWEYDYQTPVDDKFHRPEWRGQWMVARVAQAKRDDRPTDLRAIMKEIDEDKGDNKKARKLLKKARKAASKAFTEYYDKAKAKMYASVSGSREFAVDPQLRTAFAAMLEDLADSTDANVHVAFVNEAKLDPPEGTDKLLEQMRRHPDALVSFPKRNAPVVAPGDAFSPRFNDRRRTTFISAMGESFGQVFDNTDLFTLVPLSEGDSREGKIVLEVSSTIFRVRDFYFYTKNDQMGVKHFAGFLFAIEVDWGFKIFDREGKALYSPPKARSQPAKDVKVSRSPGDPTWAMYSVMMDSAYYNYAREITGKFGLRPPPEKQVFSYTGPIEKGSTPEL